MRLVVFPGKGGLAMVMESGDKARENLLDALRCRFRRAIARWNQMQWQDSLEAVARGNTVRMSTRCGLLRARRGRARRAFSRFHHASIDVDQTAQVAPVFS